MPGAGLRAPLLLLALAAPAAPPVTGGWPLTPAQLARLRGTQPRRLPQDAPEELDDATTRPEPSELDAGSPAATAPATAEALARVGMPTVSPTPQAVAQQILPQVLEDLSRRQALVAEEEEMILLLLLLEEF